MTITTLNHLKCPLWFLPAQTGRGYKRSRLLQAELLALAAEQEPMRTHLRLLFGQESNITTHHHGYRQPCPLKVMISMQHVTGYCMRAPKGPEPRSSARLWNPRALLVGRQVCWWRIKVSCWRCGYKCVTLEACRQHVCMWFRKHCCFIIAVSGKCVCVCVFQIRTSLKSTWFKCWLTSRDRELIELERDS